MSALAGRRIVVTRPAAQADELCERLAQARAIPIRLPVIDVVPVDPPDGLDAALGNLPAYDWIVFTSANGVRFVFDRWLELGRPSIIWRTVRVAAIGPATARALSRRGVTAAAMPDDYLAERILDAVGDVRGRRFLLLRADIANPRLPQRLRERGAYVDDVVAYCTVQRRPDAEAIAGLRAGADAITFTSPSTVTGLLAMLGDDWRSLVGNAAVVSIGPVTSAAARDAGLTVDAEAAVHTIDGLMDALTAHFTAGQEVRP